jgi:hypothetical protein
VAFIKGNPGDFVRLTLLKFFHFWWFAPQTGIEYPRSWLRTYQVYYTLVLAFALFGLWWVVVHGERRARLELVLPVVFVLAIAGLQSLYYVEGRHRWGVEPFLLLLAGGGACAFAMRLRSGVRPAKA